MNREPLAPPNRRRPLPFARQIRWRRFWQIEAAVGELGVSLKRKHHMEVTAPVRAGSMELIDLLAASALSLALLYPIHLALSHICILHVRRYCSRKGIPITHWRCSPALDADGTKTEFTRIEVLSESALGKRLFRFNVWIFGIRTVSEVEYGPSISAHLPEG